MDRLDKYIKELNLVFTDTVNREDFCIVGFDSEKVEVNYADSISLLHLISSFNKLYLSFKKEYEELEKLNLGKNIEVLSFEKFDFGKDNYRLLTIYIDSPTITNHKDTLLYLREINGEIKSFVTNNANPFDKNYYCEGVILNDDVAKRYLDLFEKYRLLLEIYNHLKNNQLFGDGTNYILTVIDDYDSNLLEGLKAIKISIGSVYFNTEYYAEFLISLGENFGIDYDNCRLVLDSKEASSDNANYDKVLEKVFINKKYSRERK